MLLTPGVGAQVGQGSFLEAPSEIVDRKGDVRPSRQDEPTSVRRQAWSRPISGDRRLVISHPRGNPCAAAAGRLPACRNSPCPPGARPGRIRRHRGSCS